MVDVVKGAAGFLLLSFSSISTNSKIPSFTDFSITKASSSFFIFDTFPLSFASSAFKLGFNKSALTFQYSIGSKAFISFSLSTMILTATLCTLPALKPYLTFFQIKGESSYPTALSKILLAC